LKKFYEEKCNCFNLRKFIVRLLSTWLYINGK
jgi:hypothetical protein